MSFYSLPYALTLEYPYTEKDFSRVPIIRISKKLSNSTDVGSRLRTRGSIFTEKVPVWTPARVILLKNSIGYSRFVVFYAASVHSPFSSAHMAAYKQLDKI